jgi:hypothetical protein
MISPVVESNITAAEWAQRVIPAERLKVICKAGQGHACCRYIVGGVHGICCAKKVAGFNVNLDQRAAAGVIVARGDNCSGLPLS